MAPPVHEAEVVGRLAHGSHVQGLRRALPVTMPSCCRGKKSDGAACPRSRSGRTSGPRQPRSRPPSCPPLTMPSCCRGKKSDGAACPRSRSGRTSGPRQPRSRPPSCPPCDDAFVLQRQEERWRRLSTKQKWSDVWPTADTFKASVVPLPVRMGYQTKWWRKPPPARHGNLELMKIPNFLHLSPVAIKGHCEAIKKFCTPWPEHLPNEEVIDHHFPLEFSYSDYVHAGQSMRDPRARINNLCVKLSALKLDYHARDKFLRLVGERHNERKDEVDILADRCPTRRQNREYVLYLLTALFMESHKVEPWEAEKEELDMEKFFWDGSSAEAKVIDYVERCREVYGQLTSEKADSASEASEKHKIIENLPSVARSTDSSKDCDEVNALKGAYYNYRNEEETHQNIDRYGTAVRRLLGLPPSDNLG